MLSEIVEAFVLYIHCLNTYVNKSCILLRCGIVLVRWSQFPPTSCFACGTDQRPAWSAFRCYTDTA